MIASAVLVAWPLARARAQAQPQPRFRPPELAHTRQVGLAVMPGIGYRVVARYNDRQFCLDSSQDDSKWVCTNDVPFFLDVALGYGLTEGLDLVTDVRFGLGRDEARGVGRQFAIFPGVRFWLDRNARMKFYTTVQAAFDHTRQSQDRVEDNDWGLRNANGFMYDAIRNLGFFIQVGETMGFVRWFRIEVDAGLGVQVRFP
jgi:hypothetical protein